MGADAEYGSIEREIYVEASPEVVFEVISQPEHLREWWPDDASPDAEPGGRLTETGFREQGWEIAVLEETYREHAASWDRFVPPLGEYVSRLVSAR